MRRKRHYSDSVSSASPPRAAAGAAGAVAQEGECPRGGRCPSQADLLKPTPGGDSEFKWGLGQAR
jgi:hypothetical protein